MYGITFTNIILMVLCIFIPRRIPPEIRLVCSLFFIIWMIYDIYSTHYLSAIVNLGCAIIWVSIYKREKKLG